MGTYMYKVYTILCDVNDVYYSLITIICSDLHYDVVTLWEDHYHCHSAFEYEVYFTYEITRIQEFNCKTEYL